MLIASMIVKVLPEMAQETEKLLQQFSHVTTYGVHKENNIIVVIEADNTRELEEFSGHIMEKYEAVLGVFPTYLTVDTDDENVT